MPPRQRTAEEIGNEKQKIIDKAIELISENKLSSISARKLASTLGMSAANIYQYFRNMDEIYLNIVYIGYRQLSDKVNAALENCPDTLDQIVEMTRTFINFGLENQSFYELMFSTHDPKLSDYENSPYIGLALKQHHEGNNIFLLSFQLINSFLENKDEDFCLALSVNCFCHSYGIVSLIHNNIIQQMGISTETVINSFLTNMRTELKHLREN